VGIFQWGIVLSIVLSSSVYAEKTKKTKTQASESECSIAMVDGTTPLAELASLVEEFELSDFVSTDKEKSLAWRYPMTMMSASQRYWHVMKYYPAKDIWDPVYRVQKRKDYPIFSANRIVNRTLVGHHDVIEDVAGFIYNAASGKPDGMMYLLRGPAGTGKTELLYILELSRARLSLTDPNYFNYTYYWKDLYKIPALRALFYEENKNQPFHTLGRSPFSLLPKSLQQKLAKFVEPRVRERIGLGPRPMPEADPQSKRIIEEILKHYMKEDKKNNPTEEDYLRWLSNHVKIVRAIPDDTEPTGIIRYQGKNPEYSQLFFAENMAAQQIFGTANPLSYHYTGKVVRTDGGGIFLDELFRQMADLRNTFLDMGQNGIVEAGGAPPIRLDTFVLAAANDESIEEALEEGGAKAHLDRTDRKPMRLDIHPHHVSKTAVLLMDPKRFLMRENTGGDLRQVDINELYPPADTEGKLSAPDGKYTVYYTSDDATKKPILIAPRALYMMGLTTAATRLVRDPSALKPLSTELSLMRPSETGFQHFVNASNRLKILMGQIQVDFAIRQELARIRHLLKEGKDGISSRELEPWFKEAIKLAERNDYTLTPQVLDQAFQTILDEDKTKVSQDKRATWLELHQAIKADFILPALYADVRTIVAGESGQVEKIYDEVKQELLALANDAEARVWFDQISTRDRPINKQRLEDIGKIFLEHNGSVLLPSMMATFKVKATSDEERFEPLYRAIEYYLLQTELNTAALDGLVDYFKQASVSHDVAEKAQRAEKNFERHGYNLRAFVEALIFVRDQQHYLEIRRRK